MNMKVNGSTMQVDLYKNRYAESVRDLLKNGPLTISMHDHANMEKFGSLGVQLPTNNAPIKPEAGVGIFSAGKLMVIYYGTDICDYTRLGKVKNFSKAEIKKILGKGDVKATLTL